MKKIISTLYIAFTFIIIHVNAQSSYDWALNCGGNPAASTDEARSVKTDNSGNIYIAGTFYGTADFDPGPGVQSATSAGSGDGYIAKYDANGNFLAVYTFSNNLDCKVIAIDIDNLGNVIATGHFQGTVDFDPTAGFFVLSTPGGYDFFVLKINANGTFGWAIKVGASGVDDLGLAIAADINNNVLVTGHFYGTTDFDPGAGTTNLTASTGGDAYVLKLTPAGIFSWAFNIGDGVGSSDRGLCIHGDVAGNVVVGGIFQGTCDFDPSPSTNPLTSTGAQSGFIARYTSAGNFGYAKKFDGTGASSIMDFNYHTSGDLYIAGTFTGSIDANPSTSAVSTISTSSVGDIFIVKINGSGNFAWVYQVGGIGDDALCNITSDATGVYFGGWFSNVVDFDPDITSTYTLASSGFRDFFVSKMDLNGNHLFTYATGYNNSEDRAFGIATPSANLIYVSGTFSSTVDFNTSPYGINNLTSTGGYDAFLLKLKPCAPTLSLAASTNTICAGSNVILTANGTNTVSWSTGANTSSISVTPTITTTYSVTGSFTTGCAETLSTSIQVLTCTGVNENKNEETNISIFPNPNNGSFIITTEKFESYTLINTLGQIIQTFEIKEKNTEVNVYNLSPGIYYLVNRNNSQKISITN